MTSIKTLVLAVSLLGSLSAAQASQIVPVAHCVDPRGNTDHGMMVDIMTVYGPPRFHQPNLGRTTATVSEETFAGPRQIGAYNVQRMPVPPHRMGAPVVFRGQGFDLEIVVDAMPVHGMSRSHLTIEGRRGRISEELLCRLVH